MFAVIATGLAVEAAQSELSAATYEGIQAALDALPPEGGRIFIPAGTYIMKGSLKPRDGATISGAGPATVLKACDQAVQKSAKPLAVGDRQIVMQSVQGFAVGMDVFVHEKLDWSAATQKAFSYTITAIEGNTLKFDKAAAFAQPAGATVCTGAPVILVLMRKNVVIENLTVDGNRQKASASVNLKLAGIYLWGALDCTVQNCRLDNCWGDGISAQFPPTGFKDGSVLWDSYEKHEGNGTMIVNNHIRAAQSFGIHIGGGQTKSIIRGNVVRGCGGDGLYFCWDNALSIVADNIFTENGGHGIGGLGEGGAIGDVQNIISGNICAHNGKCGIEISGGSGNIVSGNVCYGNSRSSPGAFPGIQVHLGSALVTGNSCNDRSAPSTQKCGIKISKGAVHCTVKDNPGIIEDQRE